MNNIEIVLTDDAIDTLEELKKDKSKARVLKDVVKAINLMEKKLRHPSLNTHEYTSLKGPNGEKVFEAYAQQRTPCAYRILWYYGPKKNLVSVFAIISHP